ncbi:MAG: AraC family transcriptional regulator [Polaribacter sp.]
MSKRFYITKNLDVFEFDAVCEWGYSKHKHNFFELTFVLKGKGQHIINDAIINYTKGDVFFLTPQDEHEFVVAEPTRFGVIKFTEQFFLEKAKISTDTYWRKNLETVIFHSNIIPESIVHYKSDSPQLFRLYELIREEIKTPLIYGRNVLTELFGALLVILSRNIKSSIKNKPSAVISNEEKIDTMLTYIRQNILDKERIRIKSIAEVFYMSPNYVSSFIKKNAHISIQQYVLQTKINMAKRLLKEQNLSINQIADKTGFVDASHFNKIFKKYVGKNPSEFNTK